MTYDEWLELSDAERDTIHYQWDTSVRDGFAIANMAAARLAATCGVRVYQVQIGDWHFGEYVLHLHVDDEEYERRPAMLEQRFEGFRVIWFPLGQMGVMASARGNLSGTWRHEDGSGDVEFCFDTSVAPPQVSGRCLSSGEELVISYLTGNKHLLLFSSFSSSSGRSASHSFSPVGSDTCSGQLTTYETWKRVSN